MNDQKEKNFVKELVKNLKPCPFCGGKARINRFYHKDGYMYYISCIQCQCQMGWTGTPQYAADDWNRRESQN